jgi:flagellar protein FliT
MADTIAYYESVVAASGEMLAAARQQAWDALIAAEQRCAELIGRLQAADAESRLDEAGQRRKAKIIRRVLADDAEIRRLLDPRMRALEDMLNTAVTRRRVDSAYHA